QNYPPTKTEVDEAARILYEAFQKMSQIMDMVKPIIAGTNTTITNDIFELLKLQ
ncbi:hypothetical protein BgiMline_014604, partial [Biomphalaria glabrata]